jgi:anti-anti-sigma regulatory factor
MMRNPSSRFAVTTTFEGSEAVLALSGRAEPADAFILGATLDTAIDRRPASVVLDVSDLHFLGVAGMLAVANAEKRLAEIGTELTVRSPSDLVNRLLGMMEMAERTRLLDRATSDGEHLETRQESDRPFMVAERADGSPAADFRSVTTMPSDPRVIDGALRLIVELARALVEGADGVSVSLLRHGRLSTVAASDQTIMEMDADQYKTGEGPCVDASRQGRWFHAPALADETRWPAFTPQAMGLGINSILSSPLKALDAPVGALNIYSRTPFAFGVKDQAAAAVFAKKASVILSDAGAGVSDSKMALRYQDALQSRKVITLATGVLMEREGVDEDAAFADLLRLSLYHGESLREQAHAMVRSARQLELGLDA